MKYILFLHVFFIISVVKGQYPPAAGLPGSTAIHADSSCFVGWAAHCSIQRGFINMTDTTITDNGSNKATYGNELDASGKANNQVVSLGDKGAAILTFEHPIINGPGWDFAVFENALNDHFLELAFVEVSSNGVDFVRFPSVSLTPNNNQTPSFGLTDPTQIHNLAGKYRVLYGTPFDLDEIPDTSILNKNNITHVKVIDVGGSILPEFASYDHLGNIINDPFPTPFSSGGFDLDAVGVINNTTNSVNLQHKLQANIYPNPATNTLCINAYALHFPLSIQIFDISGYAVVTSTINSSCLDISKLKPAIYAIRIRFCNGETISRTFVKTHSN
jgi:hypothetical protein